MGAVRMLARAGWRRGLGGFLLLGVVIGLGAGFAATAITGARRADSAYARLRNATLAPDHYFDATGLDDAAVARIARARGIVGAARFQFTPVAPAGRSGAVGALVATDPGFLTRVYRPLVVRGRLPRPGATDEVIVNEALAAREHLGPGDRVALRGGFGGERALGHATVVAVGRGVFDLGANADKESLLLPHAFLVAHRDQLQLVPPNAVLRSRPGRTDAQLTRSVARAAGRPVAVQSAAPEATAAERQLAVQTVGLAVLGGVALLATIAAALQFLSRRLDGPLGDVPLVVGLGLRPRRRLDLGALLAVPTAVIAALIAAVAGTLATPLVPTGFARSVDPTRGIHPDAVVLLAVAAIVVVVVIGGGALIAWRHRPHAERVTVAPDLRPARGLAPGPRLGLRAALAPTRAPDGAAARGALVTSVLAVAVVVGVLTFGSSLGALLDRPADYGWSFDAAISGGDRTLRELRPVLTGITSDPKVARTGSGAVVLLRVDGVMSEGYALDDHALALHPSVREGRAPATDTEVALGRDLAARLHVGIGDAVVLHGSRGPARVRVAGIATYPEIGNQADLASALSLTLRTARHIGAVEEGGFAVARLAPGSRPDDLRRYTSDEVGEVVAANRPPRVRNLEQVGALPAVLGTFLAVLGLLAIAHGLWRTVRGRRREFGVLATLGFRPRDLRSVVRWQALVVALVAAVVGIPLGLLLGRVTWSAVADATGVVDHLVVPVPAVLLAGLGIVGVALVAGAFAGRAVTRIRPAAALRAE